jgi:hypothetical protein
LFADAGSMELAGNKVKKALTVVDNAEETTMTNSRTSVFLMAKVDNNDFVDVVALEIIMVGKI